MLQGARVQQDLHTHTEHQVSQRNRKMLASSTHCNRVTVDDQRLLKGVILKQGEFMVLYCAEEEIK